MMQSSVEVPAKKSAGAAFEPHFGCKDLAKLWRVGRETVRQLVKDEPGVLKIRIGSQKKNTHYSVPESVARRIHARLCDPAAA